MKTPWWFLSQNLMAWILIPVSWVYFLFGKIIFLFRKKIHLFQDVLLFVLEIYWLVVSAKRQLFVQSQIILMHQL